LTSAQGSTTIASDTWNGADELTGYSSQEANMSTASYDGNGRRASATFTPAGGSAVTQDYVWDGNILLMDSVNAYIYTSTSDAPIEQVNLSTGAITYISSDSLGSARGTVNSSGSLTNTASYDAWGNSNNADGLTAITPFGYAGGYTDPDGLIYLINRYYDPATGQFISVDPEVSRTLEPYAYTLGDPVTQTDPTGLAVDLGQIASWAYTNVFTAPYIFGDDCTNFVSEALQAGGYQMVVRTWEKTDDHYWYFLWAAHGSEYNSHSWSVAADLANHQGYSAIR
jgi:RHS repeat-associated protein